jgi:multidrug resistance protein MdtO
LRDEINNAFASVNAEADAVLFESGEQRPAFLAGRDRVRRWLSSLRTLYLLELPLLPFGPSGEHKEGSPLDRPGDAQLLLRLSGPLTRIAEHLEDEISGDAHRDPRPGSAKSEHVQIAPKDDISLSKEDDSLTQSQRLLIKLASELERDVVREPVFKPKELHSAVVSPVSSV